jgi:hypothetical protein
MPIQIDKLVRAKRRTIALIVERDGSLTVRAPKRAALADIEQFIQQKSDWIERSREKLKAIGLPIKNNTRMEKNFSSLATPTNYGLSTHNSLHLRSTMALLFPSPPAHKGKSFSSIGTKNKRRRSFQNACYTMQGCTGLLPNRSRSIQQKPAGGPADQMGTSTSPGVWSWRHWT